MKYKGNKGNDRVRSTLILLDVKRKFNSQMAYPYYRAQ